MSLYTDIKAAGIATDSHESDLYFPVTVESREILTNHPLQASNATTFTCQIDGNRWYDVPFAFDPFWEAKSAARIRN